MYFNVVFTPPYKRNKAVEMQSKSNHKTKNIVKKRTVRPLADRAELVQLVK